jgi:hypothetical protein
MLALSAHPLCCVVCGVYCTVAVVVRSSLAPFDCSDLGGVRTMDAEPSIVCGVPGGPNARMRVAAALTIVAFVLGLPSIFGVFLYRNRHAVWVDQSLRERGEGDSALTNPHIQVNVEHATGFNMLLRSSCQCSSIL